MPRPTNPRIVFAAVALGVLAALGLELLCRARVMQALVASLAALLVGFSVAALGSRRRERAILGLLPVAAILAAAPGLWPDLLLGGVLGTGAALAGLGLAHEPAPRPVAAVLRWLIFPQLALIVVVSEQAYLHRLPYALLDWPGSDKVLHALLFGLAVFLLDLWLAGRSLRLGRLQLPLSLLTAFGVATLEEGLQTLSRARTGSLGDLGADLCGMVLGVLLARRLLKSRRVQASPLSPPTLRA